MVERLGSAPSRLRRIIRWGISFITLLGVLALESHELFRGSSTWTIIALVLVSFGLAGFAYWLSGSWWDLHQMQEAVSQRLEHSETKQEEIQKRLTAALQINARLADATDERVLMDAVLSLFGDLVGATGSTYVPLDKLGQPLAVLRYGTIPDVEIQDFSRLALSQRVQERCKTCTLRHASLSENCPLHRPRLFGQTEIYCLPLARETRLLGMVNLYIPADQPLSPELAAFLESLLGEIALAIDTLRMRSQEISTLRQLQLVRSPKQDMSTLLKELLLDALQGLEADFGEVWLHEAERLPEQTVLANEASACLKRPDIHAVVQKAADEKEFVTVVADNPEGVLCDRVGSLMATPLITPGGKVLGALLVANTAAQPFYPRQRMVMKTMASQAAILVENENFILDLEFRSVMGERNRLAREIHDGLAQTLAFLKLQAAQMQTYLKRGDVSRLQEVLDTSYKTLSDAYLDTRQAIDNLRVVPQESMRSWLTQAVEDFSEATRIPIDLSIQSEPDGVACEVQAQLLRIVQEALSNVRKHAHASNVSLEIYQWEKDLILEIKDDGDGFSPDDVPMISQYGLKGMRERAEMIGADFQIISSPDRGTTVRLRLPYGYEETSV